MASIFNKTNNLYENPKRNTFDHSFQNNLTFNFGELVPCFCKECLPGDSFKIDPTLSIKMIPMLFPVQTRIRAHVHFFYVSNRSLWKDWQDFIGNTKENLEIPYISYNKKKIYTGSLYDYMGLPTVSYGQDVITYRSTNRGYKYTRTTLPDSDTVYLSYNKSNGDSEYIPLVIPSTPFDNIQGRVEWCSQFLSGLLSDNINLQNGITSLTEFPDNGSIYYSYLFFTDVKIKGNLGYYHDGEFIENTDFVPLTESNTSSINPYNSRVIIYYINDETGEPDYAILEQPDGVNIIRKGDTLMYGFSKAKLFSIDSSITDDTKIIGAVIMGVFNNKPITNYYNGVSYPSADSYIETTGFSKNVSYVYQHDGSGIDISDENVGVTVYNELKISALPFRAYEAIYNSFYRDERNNPLMENGEPVYNKYILNNEGGVDNFDYHIRKRNWEADFLTTAVQSPQQGVAPLVGITSYGEISFMDETSGELYTAKLNAQDGDTIDSFTVTSPNMPQGNLKQLVDFASSGISISDLRGVNALQRWLEINMRRGLRYKDQIMSHFGVDVRYDELLMPEFIGGFSEDVYVNQVNQTTNTDGNPLGSYAGQGGSFGSSKHSITHFCQEHGYIIGIISVSPVANYSQLLPKHFLKRDLLDYYFPEFGHLGMQPILYNEVCPIEALNTNVSLNDVFGYQRAWYDYLASTDEVHGLFRTSLRNFVIGRKFSGAPELGSEFLTINHNEIDDVFAVTSSDDSHKFLGQIYFDCKIKRPIPEYGIPKLEV